MSGQGNPSTPTSSVPPDSAQEMEELTVDLGALEISEALPRLEVMKLMRGIRMDIRKFQQIVPIELSKKLNEMQSTNGEQHRGREKMANTEDICSVQELVHAIRKIESDIDELEKEYKEMPYEEDKVLMHLTSMKGHKVTMNCLLENMKKFLDHEWLTNGGHCAEAISQQSMVPVLPALPQFEISQVHGQKKTEGSSSDSDSTSSDCSEMEELEDLCSFRGPYWEAVSAPIKVLATDDEEEEMLMDASVLLGSDLKASNIITMFDESEASINAPGHQVGTSREFLLNLPLVYVCKDHKCSICRAGFPLKDRCARLPCRHHFHVQCILEWLLKKKTCPMCRHELPTR